jgi:hypothetical protein
MANEGGGEIPIVKQTWKVFLIKISIYFGFMIVVCIFVVLIAFIIIKVVEEGNLNPSVVIEKFLNTLLNRFIWVTQACTDICSDVATDLNGFKLDVYDKLEKIDKTILRPLNQIADDAKTFKSVRLELEKILTNLESAERALYKNWRENHWKVSPNRSEIDIQVIVNGSEEIRKILMENMSRLWDIRALFSKTIYALEHFLKKPIA